MKFSTQLLNIFSVFVVAQLVRAEVRGFPRCFWQLLLNVPKWLENPTYSYHSLTLTPLYLTYHKIQPFQNSIPDRTIGWSHRPKEFLRDKLLYVEQLAFKYPHLLISLSCPEPVLCHLQIVHSPILDQRNGTLPLTASRMLTLFTSSRNSSNVFCSNKCININFIQLS